MKIKTYFTSDEVLKDPDWTQDAFSLGDGIIYEMTQAELEWLKLITGKYAIADYLNKNLTNEDGKFVVKIDHEFSKALDGDCKGFGKAVMLSDHTALQTIFFYNYKED